MFKFFSNTRGWVPTLINHKFGRADIFRQL